MDSKLKKRRQIATTQWKVGCGTLVGTKMKNTSRIREACARCRLKKQKCNGQHPCQQCAAIEWTCTYPGRHHHNPRLWRAQWSETVEEALQRLFRICKDANLFPGQLPEETDRGTTIESILKGMGFSIGLQPEEIAADASTSFAESPQDQEDTNDTSMEPDDHISCELDFYDDFSLLPELWSIPTITEADMSSDTPERSHSSFSSSPITGLSVDDTFPAQCAAFPQGYYSRFSQQACFDTSATLFDDLGMLENSQSQTLLDAHTRVIATGEPRHFYF